MPAFFDRVKETSTSTGTGDIVFAGAVAGCRTFASVLSDNQQTYYVIEGGGGSEWECGVATYHTAANSITRTQVTATSIGTTSPLNFAAGVKGVWVDATAFALSRFAQTDTVNTFATDQTVNGKVNLQDNGSNRKGQLSYFDAGGAYQFGRTDHTNKFGVTVNSTDTRMSGNGAYLSSNGTVTVTGDETGGTSTVDLNRRPSDNSSGVGGTVRCWTKTSQSQNAFEVLAPGGGSALYAITAGGLPVFGASASAPTNTTTPVAWVDVKIGTTTYKMPLYL